jgi:hypothetical protein
LKYDYNQITDHFSLLRPMENRTARLTILIDPDKKRLFEEICDAHDLTPSQVVRKMIRQYVVENAGGRPLPDWLTAPVAPTNSD